MTSVENADDYEKAFMIKYIKKITEKKIKELEEKLENITDCFQVLEVKKQINNIRKKAEKEIKELQNEKNEPCAVLGIKTDELGRLTDDDCYIHEGIKIPMNIWNYLFEYQREGLKWMINLFLMKKGGVLADEMGLGKTIQVVSLVISLLISNKVKNILILTPVTLIDQWVKQFHEVDPTLKIQKELQIGLEGVFIINYEAFRIANILNDFDCVFLDEGHRIKNKDTQITIAVKRIVSPVRFIITGTPIQNNLGELWSIFDFVNPGLLGSYLTFQEEFEHKIKNNNTEKDQQQSYHYSVMLRSMIEPFILRRTKNMIYHNLPNKIDKVVFLNLSDNQYNLYCATLESKRLKDCAINGFTTKCSFLTAMTYLRKICNHALLVKHISFEQYRYEKDDTNISGIMKNLNYNYRYEEIVQESTKMKIMFEMLDKWHEESHKALIFFQSVQMLEIVANAFKLFRNHYKCLILTGSTSLKQRPHLINSFNNDPDLFVFLLTTRVGGLGVNLTGANRVIIYDPDWNPATDNQAKERIYRFGQKSNVEIYRLITKDTIEERIYQKQIHKDRLSKKILQNPATVCDREYFFDFFTKPSRFIKETIIEDTQLAEEQQGELVNVRQEDNKSFLLFKELNKKVYLTGKELIEYIKRRESSLQ